MEITENFHFPECWNDEVRMKQLFAPFRERHVNPENYDSKLKFWKVLIRDYCLFKKKAIFTQKELMVSFKRGGQEPKCLDTVLNDMYNNHIICSKEDYVNSNWSDWLVKQFVKKPLMWSINQVWFVFGFRDTCEKQNLFEYIHTEVVRDLCSQLFCELETPAFLGAVSSYNILKERLIEKSLNFNECTLKLCLIELCRNRKISLLYEKTGLDFTIQLIKVPDSNDKCPTINEFDVAVHKIQTTKGNVEKYLQNIEMQIKDNKNRLQHHLKNNERSIAKNCLRRVHVLEKSREKQNSALNSLDNLILSIEEAKLIAFTVNAYQIGSKTLRNIFNNEKIQEDNVDEIIAEVQGTLDIKNEIEDALANINNNTDTDDTELENELNILLNDYNENPPPNNNDNDDDMASKQQQKPDQEINIQQLPSEFVTVNNVDLSEMMEKLEISSGASKACKNKTETVISE